MRWFFSVLLAFFVTLKPLTVEAENTWYVMSIACSSGDVNLDANLKLGSKVTPSQIREIYPYLAKDDIQKKTATLLFVVDGGPFDPCNNNDQPTILKLILSR